MPPEAVEKLKAALDAANMSWEGETYDGGRHGWMVPDHPVYNEALAERGWKATLSFFHGSLR
jgi:carboxymethylenebutenolidase